MSDQKQVFLVLEAHGSIVSASLTLDGAMAELNRRVIDELGQTMLVNPGHYRLKAVDLVHANSTASAEISEALPKEQAEHVSRLIRINAEMISGTINVLGRQTVALLQENASLQQQLIALTAALQAKENAKT